MNEEENNKKEVPFYKRWDYITLALLVALGVALEKTIFSAFVLALPLLAAFIIMIVRLIQYFVKKDKKYLGMAKPMALFSAISFILMVAFIDTEDEGEGKVGEEEVKTEDIEEEVEEEVEEDIEEDVEEDVEEDIEEEVEEQEELSRESMIDLYVTAMRISYEGTGKVTYDEKEDMISVKPTDTELELAFNILRADVGELREEWDFLRDTYIEMSETLTEEVDNKVRLALLDPVSEEPVLIIRGSKVEFSEFD